MADYTDRNASSWTYMRPRVAPFRTVERENVQDRPCSQTGDTYCRLFLLRFLPSPTKLSMVLDSERCRACSDCANDLDEPFNLTFIETGLKDELRELEVNPCGERVPRVLIRKRDRDRVRGLLFLISGHRDNLGTAPATRMKDLQHVPFIGYMMRWFGRRCRVATLRVHFVALVIIPSESACQYAPNGGCIPNTCCGGSFGGDVLFTSLQPFSS